MKHEQSIRSKYISWNFISFDFSRRFFFFFFCCHFAFERKLKSWLILFLLSVVCIVFHSPFARKMKIKSKNTIEFCIIYRFWWVKMLFVPLTARQSIYALDWWLSVIVVYPYGRLFESNQIENVEFEIRSIFGHFQIECKWNGSIYAKICLTSKIYKYRSLLALNHRYFLAIIFIRQPNVVWNYWIFFVAADLHKRLEVVLFFFSIFKPKR